LTLRVIITAGAAGIGRVIATGFADAGAEVHVCDVDHDALEKLGRDYPAIVGDGIDVSDEARARRLAGRLPGRDGRLRCAGQ
jgi:short-subunit dehydrogenase involved in D-alanine esterification of teichoic acids